MKLIARSLDDTQLIAKEIASFIIQNQKFLVFYLEGNLGTGKTTLVRKILQNLGWNLPVKSPTFSILEEYNVGNLEIYHADLYRLNNPNDFEMLGFEPNFLKRGVLFIEWPQILQGFDKVTEVSISIQIQNKDRIFEFACEDKEFLSSINRINI